MINSIAGVHSGIDKASLYLTIYMKGLLLYITLSYSMQKKCGTNCGPATVAWVLVIIGALNWGLVGLGNLMGSNWDLVDLIFGNISWLRDIIYLLVGISGVVLLFGCKCKTCKTCDDPVANATVTPVA